jgi:hypothetical protein
LQVSNYFATKNGNDTDYRWHQRRIAATMPWFGIVFGVGALRLIPG